MEGNLNVDINLHGTITVDGTLNGTITAGGGGGGGVIADENITVSASMAGNVMYPTDGHAFYEVNAATLQNKTVTPTAQQQVITCDDYDNYLGLGVVTVGAVNLQNKTVTPTAQQQVVTADSGYNGLGSVTVEAASGGDVKLVSRASVIPTGVFEDSRLTKLSIPLCDRIEPGAFAGVNSSMYYGPTDAFELYLYSNGDSGFTKAETAAGVGGCPFGANDNVIVHVPRQLLSRYQNSNWGEFGQEVANYQLIGDL